MREDLRPWPCPATLSQWCQRSGLVLLSPTLADTHHLCHPEKMALCCKPTCVAAGGTWWMPTRCGSRLLGGPVVELAAKPVGRCSEEQGRAGRGPGAGTPPRAHMAMALLTSSRALGRGRRGVHPYTPAPVQPLIPSVGGRRGGLGTAEGPLLLSPGRRKVSSPGQA